MLERVKSLQVIAKYPLTRPKSLYFLINRHILQFNGEAKREVEGKWRK